MGFINQRSHHVWGHHLVGISLNIQVDLGDETEWTGKNYLEKTGCLIHGTINHYYVSCINHNYV